MSRSGLSNWYPYLAVPLAIITDSACMTSMTWVSNAVPKFDQDPTPSAERLLSDPATTTTTRNVPNADSGDERVGYHLNALTLSIHTYERLVRLVLSTRYQCISCFAQENGSDEILHDLFLSTAASLACLVLTHHRRYETFLSRARGIHSDSADTASDTYSSWSVHASLPSIIISCCSCKRLPLLTRLPHVLSSPRPRSRPSSLKTMTPPVILVGLQRSRCSLHSC